MSAPPKFWPLPLAPLPTILKRMAEQKVQTAKLYASPQYPQAKKQKTSDELDAMVLAAMFEAAEKDKNKLTLAALEGLLKKKKIKFPNSSGKKPHTTAGGEEPSYLKRCETKRVGPSPWQPYWRTDGSEIRSLEDLLDYWEFACAVRRVVFVGFTAYRLIDGDVFFRFVNDLDAPIVPPQPPPILTTEALPAAGPHEREFS